MTQEFVTDAIILDARPQRLDKEVDLLTKNLGRISARVISGNKTVSKLSPHLNPLNLVTIRLIKKNQFTVTDAMTKNRFKLLRESALGTAVNLLYLLKISLPTLLPDHEIWHLTNESLKVGDIRLSKFLKVLGYDLTLADCLVCQSRSVKYFFAPDQCFVCENCRKKFPEETIIQV